MTLNYLPHVLAYAENLMELEHYQFFPLAWLGAAYLLWARREALMPRPAVAWSVLGWVGVALGCLLLVGAGVLNSAWLAMVSVVPMALGWAWLLGGWGMVQGIGPSLVLFATTIRLPGGLDAELIRNLRALAVQLSSRLLDGLGVVHVPWGNVIRVPGGDLLVDEACSGIHSLVSIVAVVLFLGMLLRRRPLHLALLLIGSAGIVVVANVLRVSIVTIAYEHWSIDLLKGWKHEGLGLVLYAVSLGLAASLDQLLLLLGSAWPRQFWGRRREERYGNYDPSWKNPRMSEETAGSAPGSRPLDRLKPRWLGSVVVALGLIALLNPARWVYAAFVPEPVVADSSDLVRHAQAVLTESSLPDDLAGWKRIGFETKDREEDNPFGRHSAIWQYRLGHRVALVSVDYPFRGWHDLTGCYRSIDWTLREKGESRGSSKSTPPRATALLDRPDGQFASLRFGFVDDLGQWVDPPARTGLGLAGREMPWELITKRPNFQIQVLQTSFLMPDKDDQRQINELFEAARQTLRDQLLVSGGPTS